MADKKPNATAFALMQYQCSNATCNSLEIVWNTRDGAVPDGVVCRMCGKNQLHVNPNLDMPQPGLRAVVDMSKTLADSKTYHYLERMRADGLDVPVQGTHEYEKLRAQLVLSWSGAGQPAIIHAGKAVEAAQVAWKALERWCATHPGSGTLNRTLEEVRKLMTA